MEHFMKLFYIFLLGIPLTDGLIKMTMAKIFTAGIYKFYYLSYDNIITQFNFIYIYIFIKIKGCDQNDLLNTLEWGKDKGFHIMTCYHGILIFLTSKNIIYIYINYF